MESKPKWLTVRHKADYNLSIVENIMKTLSLNTVCDEAMCPNRSECYGNQTATFMIMGKACTRHCKFCNVKHNAIGPLDADEPEKIAQAVRQLGLKHVVITSVTRDDLSDGGAKHFSKVIHQLKGLSAPPIIEVLIPDFNGDRLALKTVVKAKPHIIGHNIETISRLYEKVRPEAIYTRSLNILKWVKELDATIYSKSGIMLGLGEKKEELLELFRDLLAQPCDFVTIGQYLAPSVDHIPVFEYIEPEIFEAYKEIAYEFGFKHAASGPLVRSSYQAHEAINSHMSKYD